MAEPQTPLDVELRQMVRRLSAAARRSPPHAYECRRQIGRLNRLRSVRAPLGRACDAALTVPRLRPLVDSLCSAASRQPVSDVIAGFHLSYGKAA